MKYLFAALAFFQTVLAVHMSEAPSVAPSTDIYLDEPKQFDRYIIPEVVQQRTASNYLTANQTFYSLNNIVKEGNPQDQIKQETLHGENGTPYVFQFSFSKHGINQSYPIAYANLAPVTNELISQTQNPLDASSGSVNFTQYEMSDIPGRDWDNHILGFQLNFTSRVICPETQ